MKNCKLSLFLICCFLCSAAAQAMSGGGVLLQISHLTFERDENLAGVKSKSKLAETDLKLGYALQNRVYLGFIQGMSDVNQDGGVDRTLSGLSLGYFATPSILLSAHYFLSGSFDLGSLKYNKPTGYQIDIEFLQSIGQNFHLGLQLAYKSVEFKELEIESIKSDISCKITELLPQMILGLNF